MFRVLPALLLLPALAAAAPGSIRFHGKGTPPVPDPVQQITPPPVDRLEIRIDAPAVPADIGATDFTLEFWMRADPGENAAGACIAGVGGWRQGNLVFDRNIAGDGDYGEYGLSLFEDGLAFGVGVGPAGNTICGATDVDAVAGAWHHVAVTRRQATGELALFVDGKLDAVGAGPPGDASYRDDRPTSQEAIDPFLMIGGRKLGNEGNFPAFSGFLDEVRLSTVIRYTADFSPPSAPFVPDTSTAALYHFDDAAAPGDCSGVVHDSATDPMGPSNGTCRFGIAQGPSFSAEIPPQLVPCTGDACVRCGNGVVENEEQCDLGSLNGADQFGNSCCDAECRLRPSGFACRTSASICERPAECPGDRAECPGNPPEPSDKPCVDGNACTTDDHCSGTGLCLGGVDASDILCSAVPTRSTVDLPGAAGKALRALERKRAITVGCSATAVRDGTRCAAEGVVSAAQLGTAAGRASDGEAAVPAACDEFRVAADRDEYRVCQSQQRALKQAGSPVALKCRPTKCLKAFLKAKRGKTLSVSMFAVYDAVGLGTEGDLPGRISAGQVQLQQRE
jgi:hypothetical protein